MQFQMSQTSDLEHQTLKAASDAHTKLVTACLAFGIESVKVILCSQL